MYLLPPAQAALPTLGSIPNEDYSHITPDERNRLSPDILSGAALNTPALVDGFILVGGDPVYVIDISDVYNPKVVSQFRPLGQISESAKFEQFQHALHKNADNEYFLAIAVPVGIEIWNITNVLDPKHVALLNLPGVAKQDGGAGQFQSQSVWGITWSGNHIYAGIVDRGIHVINVEAPQSPYFVKEIPSSQYGNLKTGTLFTLGNVLVMGAPRVGYGLATFDISDSANPVLLDFDNTLPGQSSYFSEMFGRDLYQTSPLRSYDVLSDPNNITLNPGSLDVPYVEEYMVFSEDRIYVGGTRCTVNPSCDMDTGGIFVYPLKKNLSDVSPTPIQYFAGREQQKADDQFSMPIGNIIVITDDEKGEHGLNTAVRQVTPEKRKPQGIHHERKQNYVSRVNTKIGIASDEFMDFFS